jgi:hypothetical protein
MTAPSWRDGSRPFSAPEALPALRRATLATDAVLGRRSESLDCWSQYIARSISNKARSCTSERNLNCFSAISDFVYLDRQRPATFETFARNCQCARTASLYRPELWTLPRYRKPNREAKTHSLHRVHIVTAFKQTSQSRLGKTFAWRSHLSAQCRL